MTEPQQDTIDLNQQVAQRKQKCMAWRQAGQAYPNQFQRTHLAAEIHTQYDECTPEALAAETQVFRVAGRIMMRRLMGKASFIQLQDMSGQLQLYLRGDELAEGMYQAFKQWDIGDIIGACGRVFKTKTGELSLHLTDIQLLSKALQPLPDKYHGLADQELRYRRRYLDLLVNEQTRRIFQIRSQLISAIRQFLEAHQFTEVETPMMHPIPGGAAARPFVTHHNALDMPLYLRIAPELYLKRLVVGGLERVFEINRNFRNEGLSTRHNPEFTMLEFYQAFATFTDLMDFSERLLQTVAQQILGSPAFDYQGQTIDFSQPFTRMTVVEAILRYNPTLTAADLCDRARLVQIAQQLGITVTDKAGCGKLQIEIFEKTVEEKLFQPTFITAYPTEVSPLARQNDQDPTITDRFELFIGGREIANGFSELNDPQEQAARFKAQVQEKADGDLEAMHYDQDYITALEYGLPPTAGEGIGIDRLTMLLTDSPSIRDVILFPQLRLKEEPVLA